MGACHHAALLDSVVEQGKTSGRTVRAAAFQPHLLKNMRHRIAHSRSRRKRQIHNAERHAEPSGSLLRHELSHPRYLESGALDDVRHLGDIRVGRLGKRRANNAGTAHADIHHTVGFADSVERARHEGIVLRRVAEDNQLCRAEAVVVGGALGTFADDMPHLCHRVHIDACLGGADIDGGTDPFRLGKRLRNALNQRVIAGTEALMHQRGISAEEIHAHLLCRFIEGVGNFDGVLIGTRRRHHGCRCNRNTLVDDGNAVLGFDVLAGLHKIASIAADFVVDPIAHPVDVAVGAVKQTDPHCNGAYVQILVLDHMDGFKNIFGIKHVSDSRL